MESVVVGGVRLGAGAPLVLIAGPCVIESRDKAFRTAEHMVSITNSLGIPYIYKSSFDKANRTSRRSERGIGAQEGLRILQDVKEEFGCPVTTDIHEPGQAWSAKAAGIDLLQIPSLLSRQTDLLHNAALTGIPVNIKKGQFMSADDALAACGKVEAVLGNGGTILTERGTTFGYGDVVADMRNLRTMRRVPVVMDATHTARGRDEVPTLARAGVAVGIDALFLEVHHDPDLAPCDGYRMLRLDYVDILLRQVKRIDEVVKG